MKKIPLTQGKIALVDDEDYDFLMQWKWHYIKCRDPGYAARYRKNGESGTQQKILMHRFLMGTPPGMEIDHRDNNGLNNQRYNLRRATSSQNRRNSELRVDNKSGYKGVTRTASKKKWRVYIKINGKQKWLGSFISKKDAAKAYNIAAKELFGEFANLNII